MNAVVFIDSAVISFVTDNLVPVRVMANDPILSKQFTIKWTPSLLILDSKGIEHYRTLGFYPPQDLIPSLLFGMGKVFFNRANRPAAINCFNRIIADFPINSITPEAVYMHGVSNYIQTHEVSHLIEIYNRLEKEYPDSPWRTRADPYRLLKT
ncbi:MAG: hypothetical protein ABFD57_02560 [Smithella sp.]